MKTFRLIAASFFFAIFFTVSAFAQTAASTGKIAVIDTGVFGVAKEGITKYITAQTTLDNEFKPVQTELQTLLTRIKALEAELTKAQQSTANPAVPTAASTTASLQAKAEEYEKMGREFKFKEEDAKARYERRRSTVLGPISQDISKALQEFAKQKGYTMILDGGRLFENGFILAMGDDKVDVTKEFITFYNARPAGTATTATPK